MSQRSVSLDLSGYDASEQLLDRDDFRNAALSHANLDRIGLRDTDLSSASLVGLALSDAALHQIDLHALRKAKIGRVKVIDSG